MKLEKRRVAPTDLEIIQKIYLTVKKPNWKNSDRQNYVLAACSLFFLSSENYFIYDVAIELKPYGGLIGIDDSYVDKY